MSLQWAVVILDRTSSPGQERQQDLAQVQGVDMQGSVFHPTTSPTPSPSTLKLSFPMATPNLSIHLMQQVWAGWRDDGTNQWSDVDPYGNPAPPFGGYITVLKETTYGGEKRMELTLSDYGILLTKHMVLGWPTFVVNATDELGGYPPGLSVRDWLIGSTFEGKPYDGVIRAHLGHGVFYEGVDDIFNQILFLNDTMPGIIDVSPQTPNLNGYFGFTSLGKVVQSIADQTYITYVKNYSGGPELTIGYWFNAAINGDRIVPQFNFRNIADIVSDYDFVVAADADESLGEVQVQHPHWHTRDATNMEIRVVMKGIGGDETGNAPYPLVFGEYAKPEGLLQYPSDYLIDPTNGGELDPGWGSEPIVDARLHTVQLANFLATTIGDRVWGPKGTIEFVVDFPCYPGQRVLYRDPNESLEQVYIIRSVVSQSDQAGYPLYKVQLGFAQPTTADVLKGGLPDVLLTREDVLWKTFALTSRTGLGLQKQIPIEMTPNHPHRNHITPIFRDSPALTLQATAAMRLNSDGSNRDSTPIATLLSVKPPATHLLPSPPDGTWVSPTDARPHPQVFHFSFLVDGTQGLLLHWDCAIASIHIKDASGIPPTAIVTLNKNGAIVAGPYSGTGVHTILHGTPPAPTPIAYGAGLHDDLSITVVGVTTAPIPVYITVSE